MDRFKVRLFFVLSKKPFCNMDVYDHDLRVSILTQALLLFQKIQGQKEWSTP